MTGLQLQGPLFAAPYITLSDVRHAVSELEFAIDNNVRVINLRASATTADGQSPADPVLMIGNGSTMRITAVFTQAMPHMTSCSLIGDYLLNLKLSDMTLKTAFKLFKHCRHSCGSNSGGYLTDSQIFVFARSKMGLIGWWSFAKIFKSI